MTTFDYDDDGRLVRAITEREPEWDSEQRSWLIASRMIDADTGRYGESITEAMSPDADPNNRERKYHYEATPMRVNWAEYAVGHAQDAFYKLYPDAPRHGHAFGVRKVVDD